MLMTKPSVTFSFSWGTVQLSPLLQQYQPQVVMNDEECGAVKGMIDRGNRSTQRKPAPMLLCPPQIPHNLIRAGTRVTTAGTRWLTTWVTVLPSLTRFIKRFWSGHLVVEYNSVQVSVYLCTEKSNGGNMNKGRGKITNTCAQTKGKGQNLRHSDSNKSSLSWVTANCMQWRKMLCAYLHIGSDGRLHLVPRPIAEDLYHYYPIHLQGIGAQVIMLHVMVNAVSVWSPLWSSGQRSQVRFPA
jgi:hypothetical protein